METEELFTQIQDKLEGKYYDKKTFRLIKKIIETIKYYILYHLHP